MAKPKLGRALSQTEAKSGNYSPTQTIRYGNGIYLRPGVADYVAPTPDQSLQTPQDLLGVYRQAFGEQAGQALFNSLQAPTPLSNDQLAKDFGTQFNPYFQDLQNQYGNDFNTQNTRNTQDLATSQGNINTQGAHSAADYATWQRNQAQQEAVNSQNAIGHYNQQYGDAFGSPMQQQQEGLRTQQYQQGLAQGALGQQRTQEDLQKQRDALQQGFSRRTYDLSQLNTQNLKNLENQRQTAQGNYANEYRYSNVLG